MTLSLSPKLPSRMWAMQKEIKDAYPKKVCHMLKRHVKKKNWTYEGPSIQKKRVGHMKVQVSKKKKEKR